MVSIRQQAGLSPGASDVGKVMGCYQKSIKNFSCLTSACGITACYQPSAWANFPSMIPDPPAEPWELQLVHSLHDAQLGALNPADQLHPWTSLLEISTPPKNLFPTINERNPSAMKESGPLLPGSCTKHALTSEGVDHLLGMSQGPQAAPADWSKRWQKNLRDQEMNSRLFLFPLSVAITRLDAI